MDILKYLCGIAVLFFWACEPEEQPIPDEWKKLENFASIEAQMPLGENYESQIFYSLERAEVVKKVSKMEWFTSEKRLKRIRPYDLEKTKIISDIDISLKQT